MFRGRSFFVVLVWLFFGISSASADQVTVTAGGDDIAYAIPNTTIVYQGITYTNSVYITTNSVLVFGSQDDAEEAADEYEDHPDFPSIAFNSIDWDIRDADTHLIIRTYGGGFEIDIAARPYSSGSGDDANFNPSGALTGILITATIDASGAASYIFSVVGPDFSNEVDWKGDTQRTGARTAIGAAVVVEGDATWPSFRVTRVSRGAANFLMSSVAPDLSLKDGVATCTSGDYKFATGGEAEIKSVVYTLYVDNKAVSRIAVDGDNAVVPHMFAPIAQTVVGIAGQKSAVWNLDGKSDFSARCEVTVMKQGSSFNSSSETIYDSAHYAAIEAKKAEEEKARLETVAANYTKEKREMRKRLRERAGN